jgi:hypothetical protein
MPDTNSSLRVREDLRKQIQEAGLLSDHRPIRYDPREILDLELTGVPSSIHARGKFEIEKFVGAGFAGQVYRVRLAELQPRGGTIEGLVPGRTYAVKIMKPVSRFSLFFRDLLYWMGFQTEFAPQVNADASRSGLLWQKLIRRGTKTCFGTEESAVDIYATFFDNGIGSFGEVSEWVDGRHWSFEIDEKLFQRLRWMTAKTDSTENGTSSREYLAKRIFMHRLVQLFHDMGAGELARQYEWWTGKSQPNVLKRAGSDEDPATGLTAIDFRPGLALLPFLPMSPMDFKLIFRGIKRGAWVQFDRCDLRKLEDFISKHRPDFEDLLPALEELKQVEYRYRRSLPDLTHQALRVAEDRALRKSIANAMIEGWSLSGEVDHQHGKRLRRSPISFIVFLKAGAIPILGQRLRRMWGDPRYMKHLKACLTSRSYLSRVYGVFRAETLLEWHREERVGDAQALSFVDKPIRFVFAWILLGWLPAGWHRLVADPAYAWQRFKNTVRYPFRLYFDAAFREEWLRSSIREGRENGLLTEKEERKIQEHAGDPLIQEYLKSLAVHICTAPFTQVVAVICALYVMFRFGKTWGEGLLYAAAVLAVFQGTPISPASLVREVYVFYLMIKNRNWRNYTVAALVSIWHYVGLLAFPLQMVTKYPSLSRYMVGRWATRVVRLVPVFGERGALLEHWVFDFFFNLPLSMRRSLSTFFGRRRQKKPAWGSD